MRVAVFGVGFLGLRLARDIPGAELVVYEWGGRSRIDVCDRGEICSALSRLRVNVVVNAAGKTGKSNVDWCEEHREETYRSNVVGALTLASACAEAGALLVHLGSGCIFYGRSPHPDGAWREGDHANPESFYSRTKYAADLVLSRMPGVAVVRLRMPVDSTPHSRNLITKLASYPQVADVENSVTVVEDLVHVVREVSERRLTGVFHAVNPGTVSHREILRLYREVVDPMHRCEFVREGELTSRGLVRAARSNAVLASPRLEAEEIRMRPVGEALRDAMEEYARTVRAE